MEFDNKSHVHRIWSLISIAKVHALCDDISRLVNSRSSDFPFTERTKIYTYIFLKTKLSRCESRSENKDTIRRCREEIHNVS